ncbi:DUF6011 domain-containing protein [Streptomyces sp. NPDC093509]|uniref:DUF6011 domain-containing protein n=1 Tax=Streptomyces sp. NPDC093509 TaxID=3154982 RepID=UPI00344DC641
MNTVKQCLHCDRPLTSLESQRRGYGKTCGRKHGLIPPSRPRLRAAPRRKAVKPVPVPHTVEVPAGQDALPLFYYQAELGGI